MTHGMSYKRRLYRPMCATNTSKNHRINYHLLLFLWTSILVKFHLNAYLKYVHLAILVIRMIEVELKLMMNIHTLYLMCVSSTIIGQHQQVIKIEFHELSPSVLPLPSPFNFVHLISSTHTEWFHGTIICVYIEIFIHCVMLIWPISSFRELRLCCLSIDAETPWARVWIMSIHKIYHPIYQSFHFTWYDITFYLWLPKFLSVLFIRMRKRRDSTLWLCSIDPKENKNHVDGITRTKLNNPMYIEFFRTIMQ